MKHLKLPGRWQVLKRIIRIMCCQQAITGEAFYFVFVILIMCMCVCVQVPIEAKGVRPGVTFCCELLDARMIDMIIHHVQPVIFLFILKTLSHYEDQAGLEPTDPPASASQCWY